LENGELKLSHSEFPNIVSSKLSMKPSIDVVKKLAEELGTTVGYLLGEAKEAQLLKDPVMLKRFQEINELDDSEKQCIYTFLDAFLAKNKMQAFLK
tara:strand:+ start:54 stop:341 length:288 start_codon:yes stop_codon:yes gene_type:complete